MLPEISTSMTSAPVLSLANNPLVVLEQGTYIVLCLLFVVVYVVVVVVVVVFVVAEVESVMLICFFCSGTNDKAGSSLNLLRWVSPRSIKENFIPLTSWTYPHHLN